MVCPSTYHNCINPNIHVNSIILIQPTLTTVRHSPHILVSDKDCMSPWRSSRWSTVNTPRPWRRRKHWLQHDALLIWQGQVDLCRHRHSLSRLYLKQMVRYKIETRMHNYQPIILDRRYSNVGWERPLVKISPSCSVVSIFRSLIPRLWISSRNQIVLVA